jgi:hypothetical protein
VKPGDSVKGQFPFVACAMLNDLEMLVTIPEAVSKKIKTDTEIEPQWPLGIHAIFTVEGITLGIYGRNIQGELCLKLSSFDFEEDKVPEIGPVIWDLWKLFRDVSDEVVEKNYLILMGRTKENLPC